MRRATEAAGALVRQDNSYPGGPFREHNELRWPFAVALTIHDAEADRLARELAAQTGESIDDAVLTALRERLDRERSRRVQRPSVRELFRQAQERISHLPILDSRSDDEILDYDQNGIPR
jgi:antitoxin VapB